MGLTYFNQLTSKFRNGYKPNLLFIIMSFWEEIKKIFQKKEGRNLEQEISEDELSYTGEEPVCFACDMAIHESQKSRRLDGKRMHTRCFRKISKIIKTGGDESGF